MPADDANAQQLREAILSRAAWDPAFRAGLLAEPKRTIRNAFGVVIPEGFRIRFVEKGSDLDALVVLPDPNPAGPELSESDLDTVHGGEGGGEGIPEDEGW
jgi:hypothetical protein